METSIVGREQKAFVPVGKVVPSQASPWFGKKGHGSALVVIGENAMEGAARKTQNALEWY